MPGTISTYWKLRHNVGTGATRARYVHVETPTATVDNCKWQTCGHVFDPDNSRSTAQHIHRHVQDALSHVSEGDLPCLWQDCTARNFDRWTLSIHLSTDHRVPCDLTTSIRRQYCFQCAEIFDDNQQWQDHCTHHLQESDMICRLIVADGVCVRGGTCPFCANDTARPPQKRYFQWRRFEHFHARYAASSTSRGLPMAYRLSVPGMFGPLSLGYRGD